MNKRVTSPTDEPSLTDAAEEARIAREVKDDKLDNVDRDAIDSIIMSNDVQKGGKIKVEFRGPTAQNFAHLCYIAPEDWETETTIEKFKALYGGGEYQCRTFRANGQMYKMFKFNIDPRFKGSLDMSEREAISNGKPSEVTSKLIDMLQRPKEDGIKISDFLGMMQKSTDRSSESMVMMMTMMMKSMEVSQQNSVAMMTAMMTMMTGLMGQKPSNDNQALLIKLIEQKSTATPMNETLEMMAKIKDLFEKEPEPEKEETMLDRIMKVAAPLLGGLTGQQPQQVPPGPQPGQIPPPQRGIDQLPMEYQMMFRMGMNAAEKGSDPTLYYDLIVDNLNAQQIAGLQNLLTPPDWCARLFGNENEVAHIRQWLDDLRDMILTHGVQSPNPAAPVGAAPPAGQ